MRGWRSREQLDQPRGVRGKERRASNERPRYDRPPSCERVMASDGAAGVMAQDRTLLAAFRLRPRAARGEGAACRNVQRARRVALYRAFADIAGALAARERRRGGKKCGRIGVARPGKKA